MEQWYFGDISNINTRVLLKQENDDDYRHYNLNMIDPRNYELEETNDVYNSSRISNMELVTVGELEPIIVSHLGMYLRFQRETGTYKKDKVKTRK